MPDLKWFKGTAAMAIDAFYSADDVAANLTTVADLLRSDRSYADIVAGLAGDSRWNSELFPYPTTGSQLAGDEFEQITRAGYLEAIALALRHRPPVPIKTFWMTGVSKAHFEMHVTDDAGHVAVTVVVPEVDGGSRRAGMPEAWVVKVRDDGGLHTEQTSGPHHEKAPSQRD